MRYQAWEAECPNRRHRRRGAHPDRSFRRWRQGWWWNGWWWNGWWLSRPRPLGRRLRQHRGNWTELLAMGARPRQGICLLLNRPRLFQGYAEALVLRRETGAYPFAKRAEGAPLSTPLGSDWPSRNTIETVFCF